MKVIQKINPCKMIVNEVEANHNSPVFVHLLIEALFYYGAFFVSMEECMDHNDPDGDVRINTVKSSNNKYLSRLMCE